MASVKHVTIVRGDEVEKTEVTILAAAYAARAALKVVLSEDTAQLRKVKLRHLIRGFVIQGQCCLFWLFNVAASCYRDRIIVNYCWKGPSKATSSPITCSK